MMMQRLEMEIEMIEVTCNLNRINFIPTFPNKRRFGGEVVSDEL